ncbi:hypothetical protein H4582DRAFT_2051483 [Lactarius indigo]|nr:hypothetical protein H4582DRAFT_2051483 [Lactarius indigo]
MPCKGYGSVGLTILEKERQFEVRALGVNGLEVHAGILRGEREAEFRSSLENAGQRRRSKEGRCKTDDGLKAPTSQRSAAERVVPSLIGICLGIWKGIPLPNPGELEALKSLAEKGRGSGPNEMPNDLMSMPKHL